MYRHDVYTFDANASCQTRLWIKNNVTEISQDWGIIGDLITEVYRSYIGGNDFFVSK
jgi:hypothetical protein